MGIQDLLKLRETKFAGGNLDRVQLNGTFSGYASLFGHRDLGNDVVEKGAFERSLARRGAANVRMLFQHDPDRPVGVWTTIREDEKGLLVQGQIAVGSEHGREVLELMKAGAIDGLSIGFRTIRARTDRASGVRRIIEADLWEISIVTFPMLPEARIAEIKRGSAARPLPTTREFERWLMQDAGLSRSQAKTVIGSGYASLTGRRDAAGQGNHSTAERFTKAARHLQTIATNWKTQ
ncbi:MAG: HK97 family phage prohead protease [Rhizobiaceae bacterium]